MVEDNAFGGASHLQTKEKLEVSNVLDVELQIEVLFDGSREERTGPDRSNREPDPRPVRSPPLNRVKRGKTGVNWTGQIG